MVSKDPVEPGANFSQPLWPGHLKGRLTYSVGFQHTSQDLPVLQKQLVSLFNWFSWPSREIQCHGYRKSNLRVLNFPHFGQRNKIKKTEQLIVCGDASLTLTFVAERRNKPPP